MLMHGSSQQQHVIQPLQLDTSTQSARAMWACTVVFHPPCNTCLTPHNPLTASRNNGSLADAPADHTLKGSDKGGQKVKPFLQFINCFSYSHITFTFFRWAPHVISQVNGGTEGFASELFVTRFGCSKDLPGGIPKRELCSDIIVQDGMLSIKITSKPTLLAMSPATAVGLQQEAST